MFVRNRAKLIVDDQPMDRVADFLSMSAGRPVLDRTGAPGTFTFSLNWLEPQKSDDESGVTIFSAVQQQLGLRLESARAPIEILVVDRADKVPRQN